jgi:hypothetical protein
VKALYQKDLNDEVWGSHLNLLNDEGYVFPDNWPNDQA